MVADWIKADLADARVLIEFAGGFYLDDLQCGDKIAFDFDTGDQLGQALLGLVQRETDIFMVIDIAYRPDATIQMQLIKLPD